MFLWSVVRSFSCSLHVFFPLGQCCPYCVFKWWGIPPRIWQVASVRPEWWCQSSVLGALDLSPRRLHRPLLMCEASLVYVISSDFPPTLVPLGLLRAHWQPVTSWLRTSTLGKEGGSFSLKVGLKNMCETLRTLTIIHQHLSTRAEEGPDFTVRWFWSVFISKFKFSSFQ